MEITNPEDQMETTKSEDRMEITSDTQNMEQTVQKMDDKMDEKMDQMETTTTIDAENVVENVVEKVVENEVKNTVVELVLVDKELQASFQVDAEILKSYQFFQRIFTEKPDEKTYQIKVYDALIAKDVVLSLLGIKSNSTNMPSWLSRLVTYRVRKGFLLENDIKDYYDITVPRMAFKELLKIAKQFAAISDRRMLMTLLKNLPADFPDIELQSDDKKTYSAPKINLPIEWADAMHKASDEMLVIGSTDGQMRIWDANGGDKIKMLLEFSEHTTRICTLNISERNMLSAGYDDHVGVWDPTIMKMRVKLAEGRRTKCCDISTDGEFAATVEDIVGQKTDGKFYVLPNENTIFIWNVRTGQPITTFNAMNKIKCIKFSPDGNYLITAGKNGRIQIWDLVQKKLSLELFDPTNVSDITSLIISNDGKWLVCGNDIGQIMVRDLHAVINGSTPTTSATPEPLEEDSLKQKPVHTSPEHPGWVRTLVFSPNGNVLASSYANDNVRLWKFDNGKLELLYAVTDEGYEKLAFSHDGSRMAMASENIVKILKMDGLMLPKPILQIAFIIETNTQSVAFAHPFYEKKQKLARFIEHGKN